MLSVIILGVIFLGLCWLGLNDRSRIGDAPCACELMPSPPCSGCGETDPKLSKKEKK